MVDDTKPDVNPTKPTTDPTATPAVPPSIAATPLELATGATFGGYEEFGTAKRNLPPVIPVLVAVVLVAVVVAILMYVNRAKPVAQGSFDGIYFSQPAGMTSPMILMKITLRNVSEKTLYIKDISASVKTDQGEQSDTAAAASDYDRYISAYPDLQGQERPLQVETKIAPGGEQQGTVLVSLPITKEQFDARKDATVTIQPYDQRAIVLHEKSGQGK